MSDSIFTRIINREIPADIVFEDDVVIAFRDISPRAPVHVVLAPKKPLATLNELQSVDSALMGHLVMTAVKVAKQEGIDDDGYRLVMNCNENGGQTVFHIHCHLLGGRPLEWPPG